MDTLRKISAQTFWQILAKFFSSFSTLIILSLVARNFGQFGTGTYTLALTYLSFFYLAADFGVNAHILPKLILTQKELEWRKLLGFRVILSLLLIFLALAILPLLPFKNPQFNQIVVLGILSVLPSAIYVSTNAFFQSNFLYKLSAFASIAGSLVILVLTYLLIVSRASLGMLIVANLIGWISCAALAVFFILQRFKKFLPIFDFFYIKELIIESWPITLTLFFNTLYFRVDLFILTFLKSFQEVGLYNLAYQIFQAALVIPTFIMNGYYPIMIKDLTSNRFKFYKELKTAGIAMFILGILASLATFF